MLSGWNKASKCSGSPYSHYQASIQQDLLQPDKCAELPKKFFSLPSLHHYLLKQWVSGQTL
uniref:Uncharacterized protein n=1 Tax=Lepeophtheirus salmonis TaxID=72036 RepID=A0A0K2TCI4_LEPSM